MLNAISDNFNNMASRIRDILKVGFSVTKDALSKYPELYRVIATDTEVQTSQKAAA